KYDTPPPFNSLPRSGREDCLIFLAFCLVSSTNPMNPMNPMNSMNPCYQSTIQLFDWFIALGVLSE
ncbi:hypothetical protein KAX14_02285, partial [Candidatus Bipolaricaulota bacterium]|nr:hypothetical protein [Candidatus Bipolaricaulota bacterium]